MTGWSTCPLYVGSRCATDAHLLDSRNGTLSRLGSVLSQLRWHRGPARSFRDSIVRLCRAGEGASTEVDMRRRARRSQDGASSGGIAKRTSFEYDEANFSGVAARELCAAGLDDRHRRHAGKAPIRSSAASVDTRLSWKV